MAVLFRERPSVVASWPDWELRLVEAFLAVQPAAEDRIEHAVARLNSTYTNAHLRSGMPMLPIDRFLPYLNAWEEMEVVDQYGVSDPALAAALKQRQR